VDGDVRVISRRAGGSGGEVEDRVDELASTALAPVR
jgi:hypothetical protein